MLTPSFKLSQDSQFIFIVIRAPYTNVADTEVDVDGHNFLFSSKPYLLRLNLPGKIKEDEKSVAKYECDTGDFSFKFSKEVEGEFFENLNMITSLKSPREIPEINPDLIEMLEGDCPDLAPSEEQTEQPADLVQVPHGYGFANKLTQPFSDVASEFSNIFELTIPTDIEPAKRTESRELHELEKFSPSHYLADLYEDELLAPVIESDVFFKNRNDQYFDDFTEDEVSILKELPNKSYLLTREERDSVLYGLLDILYAYCYDKRTTENEGNIETGWTINKLSATFTWFESFHSVDDVLRSSYRRSLVFPIFRNYDLCLKVKDDLVMLLSKGKTFIIKCLLDVYKILNEGPDARYILNRLYTRDYLIFLQQCAQSELTELQMAVAAVFVDKGSLGLEIVEVEYTASLVVAEENEIIENELALRMDSINLENEERQPRQVERHENQDSDDDEDSSSTDSDSSDSSSSSSSEYEEVLDSDDEPS